MSGIALLGFTLSRTEQLREFADEAAEDVPKLDADANSVDVYLADQNEAEERDANNVDAVP